MTASNCGSGLVISMVKVPYFTMSPCFPQALMSPAAFLIATSSPVSTTGVSVALRRRSVVKELAPATG